MNANELMKEIIGMAVWHRDEMKKCNAIP